MESVHQLYAGCIIKDIQLETTAKNLCGKSVYQPRPIRLQTPECKLLVKPDQLVLMFRLYFLLQKLCC